MNSGVAGGKRASNAASGRIFMWNGGSLWIGRDVRLVKPHAHHAIQISLSLGSDDSHLRIRAGDAQGWTAYRAAIVLPHRRHEFDGCGGQIAQLFVEPETDRGRALIERFGAADVSALTSDWSVHVTPLVRALERRHYEAGPLMRTAQDLIGVLAGPVPERAPASRRLLDILDTIARSMPDGLTLTDVARAVHLSPSRVRHLIVSGTGTTFRGYILWLRINRAVATMMEGHSWTSAAHEAGFADSAHLTRTFRRVFGLTPAMLVRDQEVKRQPA